jgi:WD40 repeat protein
LQLEIHTHDVENPIEIVHPEATAKKVLYKDEEGKYHEMKPKNKKKQINRIKVLPNGLVATVSNDKTAILWNVNNCTWIMFRKYIQHTDKVTDLEYIDTFTIYI